MLSASTLGIGMLLGGFIFNMAGDSIAEKVDKICDEVDKEEKVVAEICSYLKELHSIAKRFNDSLKLVEFNYEEHMRKLRNIVVINNKTEWRYFTDDEKLVTQNTVLLVALLYRMCKVKMVLEDKAKNKNMVNTYAINSSILEADDFMNSKLRKNISNTSSETAKNLFNMGQDYYLGRGCKVDQCMAVKYYNDSARLGYMPAELKLGKCYEYGYGCSKDKQKAFMWYEKAAEHGNMEAQYKVGTCCEFGRGCTIDKAKAVTWYKKAAAQGHKEAMAMLTLTK